MTTSQWNAFEKFKDEFRAQCKKWTQYSGELIPLQKSSSQKDTPDYPIETPVVYNTAMDELSAESEIKLIVIGDNPGKNEQLSINQKYLVGQAGKLGEGFFRNNPDLQIDFRKNVIILNKTPVHSAKTKHLIAIEKGLKSVNSPAQNLIEESQRWMAKKTAELHQALIKGADKNSFIPELWLVGYTELKKNGIFIPYRDELKKAYTNQSTSADKPTTTSTNATTDANAITTSTNATTNDNAKASTNFLTTSWQKVFVYQHFSMNCFNKDIRNYHTANPENPLKQNLETLGHLHKQEIF